MSASESTSRTHRESRTGRERIQPGDGPWTVLRLIRWSGEYLGEKGIENGRLDAEHLLADLLEVSRLQLYLQFDRPLTADELAAFRPYLRRRAAREPLQYILGHTPFRELDLKTDPRALIPRPETEVLVEKILEWSRGRSELRAVDVGVGTGCIALSLLKEGPFREVWGVEPEEEALELARLNAEAIPEGKGLRLVLGEGLSALPANARVDVVVSNPPYVREDEEAGLEPEVARHEPRRALFGGPDGLSVIRPLVSEAPGRLVGGGLFALEIGADQGPRVLDAIAATGAFRDAALHRDFAGRQRIVTAVRRDPGAAH